MLNAFSVDVEDWYQVSDFEDVVDFPAWDSYESRVVANTERVLGLLDRHRVKGTFFVLSWNAERLGGTEAESEKDRVELGFNLFERHRCSDIHSAFDLDAHGAD